MRPVFASRATIDDKNRLSPPPGLRVHTGCGMPFPTPTYSNPNFGSYTIESHTVPPPPRSHRESLLHVRRAKLTSGDSSGPLLGSPGTVKKRQDIFPDARS